MLQPKKTKFRRQQKGRQKGNAQRGNQLAFGSFGIKALETKWITGRQIEACLLYTSSMNRAALTNVKKICTEWQKLTVRLLISDSNAIRD